MEDECTFRLLDPQESPYFCQLLDSWWYISASICDQNVHVGICHFYQLLNIKILFTIPFQIYACSTWTFSKKKSKLIFMEFIFWNSFILSFLSSFKSSFLIFEWCCFVHSIKKKWCCCVHLSSLIVLRAVHCNEFYLYNKLLIYKTSLLLKYVYSK